MRNAFQFFLYVFALGTVILILDSYTEPTELPYKYEEDFTLCHYHQTHMPRQAIEMALYSRGEQGEQGEYLLQKSLTHRPAEHVLHFLLGSGSGTEDGAPKISTQRLLRA